jgi:hypothetical protein
MNDAVKRKLIVRPEGGVAGGPVWLTATVLMGPAEGEGAEGAGARRKNDRRKKGGGSGGAEDAPALLPRMMPTLSCVRYSQIGVSEWLPIAEEGAASWVRPALALPPSMAAAVAAAVAAASAAGISFVSSDIPASPVSSAGTLAKRPAARRAPPPPPPPPLLGAGAGGALIDLAWDESASAGAAGTDAVAEAGELATPSSGIIAAGLGVTMDEVADGAPDVTMAGGLGALGAPGVLGAPGALGAAPASGGGAAAAPPPEALDEEMEPSPAALPAPPVAPLAAPPTAPPAEPPAPLLPPPSSQVAPIVRDLGPLPF